MHRLNSSLRAQDPSITLARARVWADRLGITRVTNITRLDRVGVPVFASVRPSAADNSLCVNAGKGTTAAEAQVGAYMEAIEFAVAEPGAAPVQVVLRTPRDVLDGNRRPEAVLDFCPIAGRGFDLRGALACVEAHDLVSDRSTLVPAELVLLPYAGVPGTGQFGSNSNGLASGNSRAEAALHGLFEVIERDIRSFEWVAPSLATIDPATLPLAGRCIVEQIALAGLRVRVRSRPNSFGLPFFETVVWDPATRGSFYVNSGYGCHLVREIALLRSLTEALQSRLTVIHGGRDDLVEMLTDAQTRQDPPDDDGAAGFGDAPGNTTDYENLPDHTADTQSIEAALSAVVDRVLRAGAQNICIVPLTDLAADLHVIRVIVPRLEYLQERSRRVGPRMQEFLRTIGRG